MTDEEKIGGFATGTIVQTFYHGHKKIEDVYPSDLTSFHSILERPLVYDENYDGIVCDIETEMSKLTCKPDQKFYVRTWSHLGHLSEPTAMTIDEIYEEKRQLDFWNVFQNGLILTDVIKKDDYFTQPSAWYIGCRVNDVTHYDKETNSELIAEIVQDMDNSVDISESLDYMEVCFNTIEQAYDFGMKLMTVNHKPFYVNECQFDDGTKGFSVRWKFFEKDFHREWYYIDGFLWVKVNRIEKSRYKGKIYHLFKCLESTVNCLEFRS